ncbi:MAG: flagellar biosynthetic protein FliO [Janthinobacterium lividum]
MPAPHNSLFAVLGLVGVLAGGVVHAAPPANAPPASTSAPTIADYGGRDSSPLAETGSAAPNPAAQAGRALEALVVVLAGVVGVVYVLKRFGLVKPGANGQPARITGPNFSRSSISGTADVTVVSSQTLPGGAMLHVVRVAGRNLLLAATAQTVTTVTEWPAEVGDSATESADFEDALNRADSTTGIAAANARLRSLLTPTQPEKRL